MNTKTPKYEALDLLEKIDRGSRAVEFVDRMYEERKWMERVHNLTLLCALNQDVPIVMPDDRLIVFDVDKCLELPLIPPHSWLLEHPNIYAKIMMNNINDMYGTVVVKAGRTLPLAMLRAWWSIQE